MSIVGEVLDRKDLPAYVRFERVPVEDKQASLREGHYVAKDVDYALITPPYSKDVFRTKVSQWLLNMKQDVAGQRLPIEWAEKYEDAYRRWKNGQEIPLTGSPIRGWGVISPAQQEMLIKMNILTIEDLAGINDEGVRRIGMGSIDLKNKAVAWLAQIKDRGPLTIEISDLKAKNILLERTVESLSKNIVDLKSMIERQALAPQMVSIQNTSISASDILDNAQPADGVDARRESAVKQYTEKFGKPPHHRMLTSTIEEALR